MTSQAARVLVTGGTGFLGTHIVRALADRGAQVTAADLSNPPAAAFALWAGRPIRYTRLDVRDVDAVQTLADAVQPATIVHAAAITDAADPQVLTAVNVNGTSAVLSSAASVSARTILVSSASVYQPVAGQTESAPVLDEGSPVRASPEGYPGSKLAAEALAGAAITAGQDVVVARVAACFGPLERDTGSRSTMSLPHAAVTAAAVGRPVRAHPAQEHTMIDPAWVCDIADALAVMALSAHLPHRVYNVGAGQAITLGELAASVNEVAGTVASTAHPLLLCLPAGQRTGRLDVARLRALLVPDPTPLKQAVSTYLEWLREHPY